MKARCTLFLLWMLFDNDNDNDNGYGYGYGYDDEGFSTSDQ
eukprot:CAMPEP_0170825066 /NCGR_PEP_ID=MMETSP0733-20121128/45689_1 /TAXON_ID=186038 /ORGANISM="Fragilariopsis kerguelensis, Strain L26-C5" /LENGTH=40 /DNA_ID= /DNA_START= /DNA_END= /DNA_ORIENTATION=